MAELDIEKIVASISYQVNNDMEDFIVRVVNDYNMDSSIVVNAKKITEALEKQIPKKITYQIGKNGLKHEKCPTCGSFRVFGNYCTECGQKLDWGKGEKQ
jgi:hypothetical protein